MGDKAREVWRRSHGYTKATLEQFLKDEDWVLDDPRFRAPDFEVPQSVQTSPITGCTWWGRSPAPGSLSWPRSCCDGRAGSGAAQGGLFTEAAHPDQA
jgi:hypothetical protein